MTTRRGSRRSFRGRGARKKTYWDQTAFVFNPGPSAFLAVRDISHVLISGGNEPGGTCLRLVGNLNYFQIAASFEVFNLSVGVGVVTNDALAVGAVPDSIVDLTHDWYWWHSWEGNLGFEAQHNKEFDIRFARKLREGYRLVMVLENTVQELVGKVEVRLRTLWTLG